MPFIMQQQESMPPAVMMQRFCSLAVESLSSHAQVTFMPPGHFEKVIVQRGTITMFMLEEVGAGAHPLPSSRSSACPASRFPNTPAISRKPSSCPQKELVSDCTVGRLTQFHHAPGADRTRISGSVPNSTRPCRSRGGNSN